MIILMILILIYCIGAQAADLGINISKLLIGAIDESNNYYSYEYSTRRSVAYVGFAFPCSFIIYI